MNKKTKIVIISILVLLIIAITAGVLWWYTQKWEEAKEFNTPEDVSNLYFEYIKNSQYDDIYNMIMASCKENVSKDDMVSKYKEFSESLGIQTHEILNINCEKIDVYNAKTTYTDKITSIYGEFTVDNSFSLVKDENSKKYYINWNYGLVYPKYEPGDSIKIKTTEAKRGNIVDRNGVLLAGNGYVASVGLVPGWMNESTKTQDIEKVAELLGMTVQSVNKKMGASYVKSDTFVELDVISKQRLTTLNELGKIDGVKIKDIESRVYPLEKSTSHLTGYVQRATKEEVEANPLYDENTLIGRTGLEKAYDDRLRGENGYEITLRNEARRSKGNHIKNSKK